MIAKIVVHGPTRAAALRKLSDALARTEVAGSVTNLAFLSALARHPGFAAGDVDTGLIARDLAALTAVPARPRWADVLAVLAAAVPDMSGGTPAADPLATEPALSGFTLWAPLAHPVTLRAEEENIVARLAVTGPGRAEVTLGDTTHRAEFRAGGWWIDGARVPGRALRLGDRVTVFGDPAWTFVLPDPLDRRSAAAVADGITRAPMPGLVKSVFVGPGDAVAAGQPLAVLEAMKMEHTLAAASEGTVAEVLAGAGTQVEAGAALIRMEGA